MTCVVGPSFRESLTPIPTRRRPLDVLSLPNHPSRPWRGAVALALCSAVLVHAPASPDTVGTAAAMSGCPSPEEVASTVRWHAAWGSAMIEDGGPSARDATYRLVVRSSLPGRSVRVRLSNALSDDTAHLHRVTVGIRKPAAVTSLPRAGAAVRRGTVRPVRFATGRQVAIRPGGAVRSAPVALRVEAGDDLVVSIHVRQQAPMTMHNGTDPEVPVANAWGVTQYVSAAGSGDLTEELGPGSFEPMGSTLPWLDAVDVRTRAAGTVVAFGDSITEGSSSAIQRGVRRQDRYDTYPDFLAERLQERVGPANRYGVVNAGIGNNTLTGQRLGGVLGGIPGRPGERRLGRDVLARAGVTHVVLLMGTNDLTYGAAAQDVIAAYRRVGAVLRQHCITFIGATILPRSPFLTPQIEAGRQAINRFIRTSPVFDDVVDFDRAMQDQVSPSRLYPPFDDGDGVHPTPAGYRHMAATLEAQFPGR